MKIIKHNKKLGDFMKEWALTLDATEIKAPTKALYKRYIRVHLEPNLGNIPVYKIDEKTIREFTHELLTNGNRKKGGKKGLSEKTTECILIMLSTILSDAVQKGYLKKNPMLGVKFVKVAKKQKRVFSRNEQEQIERISRKKGGDYLGIIISLYSGLRVGELCALRWTDVDFEQGVIYVRHTVERMQNADAKPGQPRTSVIMTSPKSKKSERVIPLSLKTLELLRDIWSSRKPRERTPESYVFYKPTKAGDGKKFVEPRTFQSRIKDVVKEAGLADASFHATRHSFATRCMETSMDIKSLSEILGHSNVNITLDVYVHSFLEAKRTCMQRLDGFFVTD